MQVVIKNIISGNVAAFHSEGLRVYEELEKLYKRREAIELSFEGITLCATQFLNACIGKLYLMGEPSVVDSLLSYTSASDNILNSKIPDVRSNAINYKKHDKRVEEATSY